MFVPVSCTNCGKPFQVPEAALGKLAPCPWCQEVVTALPVSAPVPVAQPARPPAPPPPPAPPAARPQGVPMSLDDAPASAPLPDAPAFPHLPAKSILPTVFVMVGVSVVIMAVTMFFLGFRSGRFTDVGWSEFTAPDGSFSVALPGAPAEEDVPASPADSIGPGKRFSVHGWYTKTSVWIAYNDLDPGLVQKLPSDRTRSITAGVLRLERDREVARLKGTITKEAEARVNDAWGVELHMDTPNGQVVEWLMLVGTGPRPRLYAYGVEGKNVTPVTPACARLFKSFRLNE